MVDKTVRRAKEWAVIILWLCSPSQILWLWDLLRFAQVKDALLFIKKKKKKKKFFGC